MFFLNCQMNILNGKHCKTYKFPKISYKNEKIRICEIFYINYIQKYYCYYQLFFLYNKNKWY